ncbi:hypothetical protein FA13DRAFT_1738280 [Coprinellus micaceus]|uniref:Uncharacterized protein n=1 Tax=Coprinellus micaceus TaxID=71717 RepID=A0A4Y7RVY6_COPMI|nr:hypothetical protein FA13DRAFT_1748455 [Coprinellus micaceus]TEB25565.1 hypothetical protein FA13DRAFT_1738280 [Coprinellus micaceus]
MCPFALLDDRSIFLPVGGHPGTTEAFQKPRKNPNRQRPEAGAYLDLVSQLRAAASSPTGIAWFNFTLRTIGNKGGTKQEGFS